MEAWEDTLLHYGLLEKYPDLPHNLHFGFPIGDMAHLDSTCIFPNHATSTEHLDFIQGYVDEQVKLGQMTGLYSQAEVERILDSPFISSPLAVVNKPGKPSRYRLVQNCSFEE